MPGSEDTNAALWKSDDEVARWVATADERELHRTWPRRLMAQLLPFATNDAFTFVDLGAGTGAASAAVLARYPAATAVLADFSPQMMAQGPRALNGYEGRYRYVELDLSTGRWPDELRGDMEAAISSLCVHHLPDERKGRLFAEICERLRPGAWYFNYDPVAAESPSVQATWQRVQDARDPEAANRRAHRTPAEHARWENHVRHITLLAPQLDLLRAAGFDGVDVYWKELDHVIYGGRRPPADDLTD